MKQNVQTKIHVKPLRFALSIRALSRPHTDSVEATRDYMTARKKERNTIKFSTKSPRPVFEERVNLDTPPAITDHVRELARLIKTHNAITQHLHYADYDLAMSIIGDKNDAPIFTKRIGKITPLLNPDRPRPLWVCEAAPVKDKEHGRIYTEYSNIQPEDKPAFRHDCLFLFDKLSEDYTA